MKVVLRLLVLSLLFFTPLIFTTSTQEVFEFPKMFFVYIFGLLLVLGYLLGLLWYPKKFHKPKLPPLPVLGYLVAFVISTIFSSHLFTSINGYYTRFNDGLLSALVFLGFYTVVRSLFSPDDKEHLLVMSVLPLLPVSLYAILQHFGFSVIVWKADPEIRAFSTFGQPNWMAQYLVMLLPLTLYFSITTKKKLFWALSYVLGFAALWFSYSMSGLLGFFAAILVMLLVLNKRHLLNLKVAKQLLVLGIISLAIMVTRPGIFGAKVHDIFVDIKNTVSVVHTAYAQTDEYLLSDPGSLRFGMWQGTWHLITSSPKIFFVGSGPETFPYTFQQFRPKSVNYSSEWNFVLNKPHNYYLELWAELGLIGLTAYIFLGLWSLKNLPKHLLPGLVGLFVTNIFGWPVVATSMLWWFWLTFAYTEGGKNNG